MHPIVRAAELHTRFVKIHPFAEGNGRTGRLLLNFELMSAGYPAAIIRIEDQRAYFDALVNTSDTTNFDEMAILIAVAEDRSLDIYLSLIVPPP